MAKFILLLILSLQLLSSHVFGADKKETVMEGDSATLIPDPDEIKEFFEINWWYGDPGDIIAEFDRNKISYANKRFGDRLELNNQTGSLTVRNMKTSHSGLYKLQIEKPSAGLNLTFLVTVYESPSVIDPNEAEMKSVSVTDGDSVTLQTVTELHGDELIVWRFGAKGKLIAKQDIEAKSPPSYDTDERFRDRLELDHQTGSLTIRNIKVTDIGVYTVKISSNKQTFHRRFSVHFSKSFNFQLSDLYSRLSGEGWSSAHVVLFCTVVLVAAGFCLFLFNRYCWTVKKHKMAHNEGECVTLCTGLTGIKKDDEIQWWYVAEDKPIAEIKGGKYETRAGADERFFGKLKVDAITGDLTISNIKGVHYGLYTLEIKSSNWCKNIIKSIFRAKYQRKCIIAIKVIDAKDSVTVKMPLLNGEDTPTRDNHCDIINS